jgi:LacI family transcriptional regulator
MPTNVTLRDVARRAKCSLATVSLALRDSPRLPAATRRRVRRVAELMGYRRDPVLAALVAHRWQRGVTTPGAAATIAALADGRLEGYDGMVERAVAYGYRLEIFQISDYPDPRRLAEMLYARGILGIIVGQIFTSGFCAAFDWTRFVTVACSEGIERPPVHLVMPNHFRAVQQGWDWAWENGFRRIGLALFDMPEALDFHDRCAAFLERQQRAAPAERLPWAAIPSHAANDVATKVMQEWVRAQRPDIVLGFNGFFHWLLRDAGFSGRREIPFLDLWISQPYPMTTGLRLYPDELGRRAVEWLDTLMRVGVYGAPEQPATMAVDFVWQEGDSLGRKRQR